MPELKRAGPEAGAPMGGTAVGLWLKWLICVLALVATTASALEVKQVKWGFDGQVVPGHLNILSVLVANSSPAPFDGAVRCYKGRGLEERVGAIYETPCYLSPLSARWLQFYVFIDNQYDQWRLDWGRAAADHQEIEPPKWSSAAQVLLSDSETLLNPSSPFKQFPEELFPPTVAATSGLGSVLLDHAPHWEPAKRQAFLNWLRAGGTVHVLLGMDGRFPVFADELGVLNSPAETADGGQTYHVGAGLVTRHAATARNLRREDVRDTNTAAREFKPGNPLAPTQSADAFFQALARLSQRRYNWGGIYLLAFAYLALIGPGNIVAGRKFTDYRLRIALLLATIAVFAGLFNFVGRRGQGESSVIHTLSYARAIDGDTYDVMQWANVFATRGAQYTITHAAPHNLYATGQEYESVNGMIENGKDGRFVVDIPMFSRRAFLHAGEMKGAQIPVKIASWTGTETLKKVVVTVGPDFATQVLSGWLVQGEHVYAMKKGKDGLEFDDAWKESLETFVGGNNGAPVITYGNSGENEVTNVEDEFQKLTKPLLVWSLGGPEGSRPKGSTSPTDGRVQLFLYARSPQGFGISGSALGREVGYVLYHFILFKPGTEGKP